MASGAMESCAAGGSAASSAFFSSWIVGALTVVLAIPTVVFLVSYMIPHLVMMFRPVPNLKKRYDASWALVTGGGSGIGRALCFQLAAQGLNVVVVSMDDEHLTKTMSDLKTEFPKQEFRSVACLFSPQVPYLDQIIKCTEDLEIKVVFNNAGFMITGFYDSNPLPGYLAQVECNATAAAAIGHFFLQKMVQHQWKGCIVFTSSVVAYMPTPFASVYGCTKAFVSSLAACLHIEVKHLGIDVCAVHPSPVQSNFFQKVQHKIDLMESAQKGAVAPDVVCREIFKSIGYCALRDIGGLAMGTRIGTFFLFDGILAQGFALAAPYLPDYVRHNATRLGTKKKE